MLPRQNSLGTKGHFDVAEHPGELQYQVQTARIGNGLEIVEASEQFAPAGFFAGNHFGSENRKVPLLGRWFVAKQTGRFHVLNPSLNVICCFID